MSDHALKIRTDRLACIRQSFINCFTFSMTSGQRWTRYVISPFSLAFQDNSVAMSHNHIIPYLLPIRVPFIVPM